MSIDKNIPINNEYQQLVSHISDTFVLRQKGSESAVMRVIEKSKEEVK